ncbi:GyrI-like domain-containing protein [Pelagibacterium halotolerans]|uniref:GyrI-like domain-containing protein n=1 Tax=Pelagibacterium halotolerans TaxID=531813 RepID=UPI00384BCBAE
MHDFEVIETHAQPMLYVTRQSSMDSEEIAKVMEDAFGAIGRFIGENQVSPAGPPLAIYSDWDGAEMTVKVGFPVSSDDAGKAGGDIHAGETPAGRCVKAIHHGAYDHLRETYAKLEQHFKTAHTGMPALTWEVYPNDPDTTPEDDLITEIYMPLPNGQP